MYRYTATNRSYNIIYYYIVRIVGYMDEGSVRRDEKGGEKMVRYQLFIRRIGSNSIAYTRENKRD